MVPKELVSAERSTGPVSMSLLDGSAVEVNVGNGTNGLLDERVVGVE